MTFHTTPISTTAAPLVSATARKKRQSPEDRITTLHRDRVSFYLSAGYSSTRTSEITGVPVWYCEVVKAGGTFAHGWVKLPFGGRYR